MKKLFVVCSFLFTSLFLIGISAQAQVIKDSIQLSAAQDSTEQKVYDIAEQMPKFPGGQNELFKFISQNIKYPVEAEENNIQGRVIVSFVVERDGSITDISVIKSVHPLLDNEAIRITKLMPKWIPAKQNGETVRVRYTVPVTFRLMLDKKQKDPKMQPEKKWTGKPLTPWNK